MTNENCLMTNDKSLSEQAGKGDLSFVILEKGPDPSDPFFAPS
jgi:hypothetical protein